MIRSLSPDGTQSHDNEIVNADHLVSKEGVGLPALGDHLATDAPQRWRDAPIEKIWKQEGTTQVDMTLPTCVVDARTMEVVQILRGDKC